MKEKILQQIQGELAKHGLDGWLLYDFHGSNDVAVSFLKLTGIVTRRSFYLIPSSGLPVAFVHNIEKEPFEHLLGEKEFYSSYRVLEEMLRNRLTGQKRLAMEYSEMGRLPYIGKVDAGTIELVRSFGVEVVSSADLVSKFSACLTEDQIALHRTAAQLVNSIKDEAFALIKSRLESGTKVTEYDVTQFIMEKFASEKMVTDHPPICGVGKNGGNPHYVPTEENSSEIKRDDLILIDLWAKLDRPGAVMADITWMAFAGPEIPEKFVADFQILCMARDAACSFISKKWKEGTTVYGYQVDDVCRGVIEADEKGAFFTHRTGHSIFEATHGPGPNIDNLETEDRRRLLPGHLFSIEPGLYMEDYGLRTEINVLITESGPEITSQPVQTEILRLFE